MFFKSLHFLVNKSKSQNGVYSTVENGSLDDDDSSILKVLLIPFDACSEPSATIQKVYMKKEISIDTF